MLRLSIALMALLVAACAERTAPAPTRTSDTAGAQAAHAAIPYRLEAPDAVFRLPGALREASGLAVLPSGRLATVQDEAGIVYEIDPATGRVLHETPFAGGGDFEGIEWGADALWVLRSNGDLYRLVAGQPAERIRTPLKSRNDCEGLGWDAARKRLLIAAKAYPGEGLGHVRAVYAFDPATRAVSLAFTLDRRRLDTPDGEFRPSAVAVHPTSGLVYVLSSARKAIAVVDPDGRLVATADLPSRLYPQPEGLAFLPDGTLFIESEGAAARATLLRFSPVRS